MWFTLWFTFWFALWFTLCVIPRFVVAHQTKASGDGDGRCRAESFGKGRNQLHCKQEKSIGRRKNPHLHRPNPNWPLLWSPHACKPPLRSRTCGRNEKKSKKSSHQSICTWGNRIWGKQGKQGNTHNYVVHAARDLHHGHVAQAEGGRMKMYQFEIAF